MRKLLFLIIAFSLTGIMGGSEEGYRMYSEKLGIMQEANEELKDGSYNAVYISEYSLENLDFEIYQTYFLEKVLPVSDCNADIFRITEYAKYLSSENINVRKVYIGLDYLKLEDPTVLVDYVKERRDINWVINVSPASYIEMNAVDNDAKFDALDKLVNELAPLGNVRIISPVFDKAIVMNTGNFDKNGLVSGLTDSYFREEYVLSAGSIPEKSQEMKDFLNVFDTDSYTDFSDYNLVFFGDSIIANANKNDSIPAVINYLTDADTFNYAIGGSTASLREGSDTSFDFQIEKCIYDKPQFYRKTIFVINFGANDYFFGIPAAGESDETYEGALRNGILKIKETYPDCDIIVASPTHIYEREGLSINGIDYLKDYRAIAKKVAEETGSYYLDNYSDFGLDDSNCKKYYEDTVHLNVSGRVLYAENLISRMKEWYGR